MHQYTDMPKHSNVNCRWRQWTKTDSKWNRHCWKRRWLLTTTHRPDKIRVSAAESKHTVRVNNCLEAWFPSNAHQSTYSLSKRLTSEFQSCERKAMRRLPQKKKTLIIGVLKKTFSNKIRSNWTGGPWIGRNDWALVLFKVLGIKKFGNC